MDFTLTTTSNVTTIDSNINHHQQQRQNFGNHDPDGGNLSFLQQQHGSDIGEASVGEGCYYSALVAMATVIVTAVLGNVCNMLVIARSSPLRHSLSNFFVMSLCTSDLLAALLVMPLAAVTFALGGSPLDEVACSLVGFATSLFMFVSLTTLTAISVERYYSIRLPMHHAANMSFCKTLAAVVCVWLWSALLASLPLAGFGSYEYHRHRYHCSFGGRRDDGLHKVYVALVVTLCFLVPGSILVAMYAGIFRVARQAAIQIRPLPSEASRATASVTNTAGLFFTRASKDEFSAAHSSVIRNLRSCRRVRCKTSDAATVTAAAAAAAATAGGAVVDVSASCRVSWATSPPKKAGDASPSAEAEEPGARNSATRTCNLGGAGGDGRSITDVNNVKLCHVKTREEEDEKETFVVDGGGNNVRRDNPAGNGTVVVVDGGSNGGSSSGGGDGRGRDGGRGGGGGRGGCRDGERSKTVDKVKASRECTDRLECYYGYREDSGIASQDSDPAPPLPPPRPPHRHRHLPSNPTPPLPLHQNPLPPPPPSSSSVSRGSSLHRVVLRANTLRPMQGHLKAAKTLLLLLTAYTVLWGPFFVSHLHGVVSGSVSDPQVTDLVSLWLGFASFAVNPILYGWMNKAIREELVQLYRRLFFRCCCCVWCSRPEAAAENELFQDGPSDEDFLQFLERTSCPPRAERAANSRSVFKPELSELNVESSDPF